MAHFSFSAGSAIGILDFSRFFRDLHWQTPQAFLRRGFSSWPRPSSSSPRGWASLSSHPLSPQGSTCLRSRDALFCLVVKAQFSRWVWGEQYLSVYICPILKFSVRKPTVATHLSQDFPSRFYQQTKLIFSFSSAWILISQLLSSSSREKRGFSWGAF